jgi:hypothetical protein
VERLRLVVMVLHGDSFGSALGMATIARAPYAPLPPR